MRNILLTGFQLAGAGLLALLVIRVLAAANIARMLPGVN